MIEYRGFTKIYGGRAAVDQLTLTVPAGAVVALLGPNGSGKTTTIKAAAGLIRPDAGDVLLGEERLPALDPRARRLCSFLPQRVAFPEALSGREVVEFYRQLRGAPRGAATEALALASLNGASGRPIGGYSGGMVQRLGLAVASLGASRLLLLDEPTAALDADGLATFYELIGQRRRDGATTLFSSHQLGDIERLADRVAVIVGGKLVAELTARDIAARLSDRGVMRLQLAADPKDILDRIRERAPGAQWSGIELVIPGLASDRPAMLDFVRGTGAEITGLATYDGRLDEFYRDLIGGAS